MLSDIHSCKRDAHEDSETYANKFEARVSKYGHQKNTRSPLDDQQWALLLLQNANLTADTRNSITFQLTTGAAMRKEDTTTNTMQVSLAEINEISRTLAEAQTADTSEERNDAADALKERIGRLEKRIQESNKAETPTISFYEAVCALKQVHIAP